VLAQCPEFGERVLLVHRVAVGTVGAAATPDQVLLDALVQASAQPNVGHVAPAPTAVARMGCGYTR
jgi:hypothetical protein